MLTSNESRLELVRGEGEVGGLNWKLVSEEEEGGGVEVAIETLPFLSVSLTMAVVVDWSCDCCCCFWCVAPPTLSCPAARSHTLAITFTQLCGWENVSTEHSLSAACRYMYMCICMYTCILYMCMHLHVHVHVLGVYSLYKCRDMHEYVCMCSCFALCILHVHVHVCGALLV